MIARGLRSSYERHVRPIALIGVCALVCAQGCVKIATSAGTPTALERQLLGAYDELDRELVLASSVRGDVARSAGSPESVKALAIEGRALQRFNEDDVAELKTAGCLAETLEATVVPRPCSLASDAAAAVARRRDRVVQDENRARRNILSWAALVQAREAGRDRATPDQLRELRRTYHLLLRESAGPGHLFEVSPGEFRPVER